MRLHERRRASIVTGEREASKIVAKVEVTTCWAFYGCNCGVMLCHSPEWRSDDECQPEFRHRIVARSCNTEKSWICSSAALRLILWSAMASECVRGLRYSVERLLDLHSSGMTQEQVLADYEDLEREDVLAVIAYAAQLARTRRPQADNP